jgi:modulator of FtsH protease HflC
MAREIIPSRVRGSTAGVRSILRKCAPIAVLALIFVVGSQCLFSVDNAEYAIVTDFGKPTQVVTSPGLGFKLPYQSVRTFDRRLFVYASTPSEFLTREKTPVIAAGTVVWRVADPRKFYETVLDQTGAESRLGDILFAELGATVGRSPFTTFVSTDTTTYGAEAAIAELGRRCRDIALSNYGIDVVDVQLRQFDFPKQNRLRLYARMKSERGRISMQFRSEGEEEGLKVRAVAEEEKARILSSATELSQQRRGEGEGDAARIYAQALSQSPDFYAFQRTMQAARNFANKNTTMVLPADSPLFGVLLDSNYFGGAGVAGAGTTSNDAAPKVTGK